MSVSKEMRVLSEIRTMQIGDPIAVEIGSTESNLIIIDTFFMGLSPNNRVRFISYNNGHRPLVVIAETGPENVRTSGYREGIQRDGLFNENCRDSWCRQWERCPFNWNREACEEYCRPDDMDTYHDIHDMEVG